MVTFLHGYEHLIGGLCGGVASTMTCHPFDLLKIRYSANEGGLIRPKYNGYVHAVKSILKANGLRGLYQGLSPSIIGAPISWGMYFHLYHKVRSQLELFPAMFANNLLAGCVTGGIVLSLTNPMWVCKTRLCLQYESTKTKQYKNLKDCMRQIYITEGVKGFYRGFIPGLMGTTNGAIQFAIYNQMKDFRCKYLKLEQDSELTTFDYLLFSSISKISSTVLTFPYQVLRTRLQDQHANYNGVVDCTLKTFKREGMKEMFGYFLDVLSTVISAALPVYHTWKALQSRKTRPLVPLAKYWTVFGAMTIMESVASLFNLPNWLPGYSLLKFVAVIYLYGAGYERVYNDFVSPFLKDYEPTGERMVGMAKKVGPKLINSAANLVAEQVVTSLNSFVVLNNMHGQHERQCIPTVQHHAIEVLEEDQSDEECIIVE